MDRGPFDIAGRNAIVTGGAMGIGAGIVDRYTEAGANVLVADIDEDAVHRVAEKLAGSPGRVVAMSADVAEVEDSEAIADRCAKEFGSVDILVNNAGIYPQVPMLEMPPELFDRILAINLRGLAFLSQAAARRMVEQEQGGVIINISSIDAFRPSIVGLAAYDASKGGVTMFTKNLALELAPRGVRVVAIAPGGITTEGTEKPFEGSGMTQEQMARLIADFTERIPVRRMGRPDEIATVAVFLASEAASYITGTTVVVDGGALLT